MFLFFFALEFRIRPSSDVSFSLVLARSLTLVGMV